MEEFFAGFLAGVLSVMLLMAIFDSSTVDIIEKGFAKWKIVDTKTETTKFVWKTLDKIKK
jgi:hypothetical protein